MTSQVRASLFRARHARLIQADRGKSTGGWALPEQTDDAANARLDGEGGIAPDKTWSLASTALSTKSDARPTWDTKDLPKWMSIRRTAL